MIVTTPDKPQGRKLEVKPNVVKQWAIDNGIPCHDPAKLDAAFVEQLKVYVEKSNITFFVVASYGKIIPEQVLSIPPSGTLNIHPSLLPKYRGPSPLPTAILDDEKHTGVSIMKLDSLMDHGPVVAQRSVDIVDWPTYEEFEQMMAKVGTHLLVEALPKYLDGALKPVEQDHTKATYTKKIVKEDGLIDIDNPNADLYLNFRKIQAYHEWPKAYFMADRRGQQIRVKVTKASFKDGKLTIEKVIPEGGKEMLFTDFERGLK